MSGNYHFIKRIVAGVLILLAVLFVYDYFKETNRIKDEVYAQSSLIEKQLLNVSKLVVTEASYAKVYSYKDKETYGLDIFTSEKRALVVSNATAQVSYDLRQMKYDVNQNTKTITITYIPEPELKVDPNLQFYQMDSGYFNKFEATDLNKIKTKITKDLRVQIKKSDVVKNAQQRLIIELSNLFFLTKTMGWKMVYDGNDILEAKSLEGLMPKL